MIESLEIHNFTCFDKLKIDFDLGVNIFIGDNGTGKTHILKLLYSVIASKAKLKDGDNLYLHHIPFNNEIIQNFMAHWKDLLRKSILMENQSNIIKLEFKISEKKSFCVSFDVLKSRGSGNIVECNLNGVYIPAKDMLANAPYFLSLYEDYKIHFEKVYRDILLKANSAPSEKLNNKQKSLIFIKNRALKYNFLGKKCQS